MIPESMDGQPWYWPVVTMVLAAVVFHGPKVIAKLRERWENKLDSHDKAIENEREANAQLVATLQGQVEDLRSQLAKYQDASNLLTDETQHDEGVKRLTELSEGSDAE